MRFFNVLKLLFPKTNIFELIFNSRLRKFIKGLSLLLEDVHKKTEEVFFDIFPETTRAYNEWEKQFAVLFASEQYGDNRVGILKSLWKANIGGQSLNYIEQVLQEVIPSIHVYENNPVKNPRDANAVFGCMCGQKWSVAGNKRLCCGFKDGDSEFVPAVIRNNSETTYDIPVDVHYWENYFFVAGSVVRNSKGEIIYCEKIFADKKWKPYIEYLVLKLKPVHTGIIIFIKWIENYDEITRLRRKRNA